MGLVESQSQVCDTQWIQDCSVLTRPCLGHLLNDGPWRSIAEKQAALMLVVNFPAIQLTLPSAT